MGLEPLGPVQPNSGLVSGADKVFASPTSGSGVGSFRALVLGDLPSIASTNLTDVTSGVWTPVLVGQTTPGTQTYSNQAGVWYKTGNRIDYAGCISLSAFDAATAGNINITGLPYVASNTNTTFQWVANCYVAGVALDAGYTQFVGYAAANTSRVAFIEIGSNIIQKRIQPSNMTNTSTVNFTGWYNI